MGFRFYWALGGRAGVVRRRAVVPSCLCPAASPGFDLLLYFWPVRSAVRSGHHCYFLYPSGFFREESWQLVHPLKFLSRPGHHVGSPKADGCVWGLLGQW